MAESSEGTAEVAPSNVRREAKSLLGGSALIFGGRIAGAAATYGAQLFIANWVGKAALGEYAVAFAWCLILSDVALLGVPAAGLRFIGAGLNSGDRAAVAGFIRRTRQVALGVAIGLAGIAAPAVYFTTDGASAPGAAAMVVALAVIPALTLLRHQIGVAYAFRWLSMMVVPHNVLRPILFLASLGALWALGAALDSTGAMLLQAGAIVVTVAGVALYMSRRLAGELQGAQPTYATRSWYRTSAPLLFVSLFNGFFPEINVVLFGLFAGHGDVAVFNAGIRTAFFIGFGLQAVDQATLPGIARLFAARDLAGMQRALRHAAWLKCGAGAVAVGALALLGEPILGLFGEDFVVGYGALMVLAVTQLARAVIGPVGQLLGVTGHQDQSLLACAGSLPATIVLNALLAPRYGLLGVAISVFIVTLLANLWMLRIVVKRVGVWPSLIGRAV